MTDKELLYIKTIADEGSISKASKKLYMTQPSLSHCLQHVEEVLNTQLFVRSPFGLTLTYAGEKYYRFATQVLNLYNNFQMEITDISELKKGRITIGTTFFLGSIILPRILPELKSQFPNIEVIIQEMTADANEEAVVMRKIDFSVIHKLPEYTVSEDVLCSRLRRFPFVVVASSQFDLSRYVISGIAGPFPTVDLSRILDLPFISLARGKRIRQVSDGIFSRLGASPNTVLTTKSFDTAYSLSAQGYGIALLPWDYIHYFKGRQPVEYYLVGEEYLPYWDLCIEIPSEYRSSRLTQHLTQIVQKHFSEMPEPERECEETDHE